MNCPYCNREVYGVTGFIEAQKFEKHLRKCRKNPNNMVLTDGKQTVLAPKREQNLMDALKIRSDSGQ